MLRGDVTAEVAKLKEEPGKGLLLLGSSSLWLHPLVLGQGKRLFRKGGPTLDLRLVNARTTSTGLVILTYEPARPVLAS